MKSILYISYDGLTDPLGQSQILPYLIGLSKLGYQFHVISFEKENRFNELKSKIEGLCTTNQINWVPLKYSKRPPIFSTLFDVFRMKKKAFQLHEKNQFQIIHCRSYISALIGLSLKRKGLKFIFDMRGFWIEERVEGRIWNLKNPIYKLIYKYFKRKEKAFLLQADQIITLTNKAKSYLLENKIVQSESKISVIPCCMDESLFDPSLIECNQKSELMRHLGITNDDLVLGYVGSIGTWYMLAEMFDCFKVISEKNQNLKFLIVTKDSKKHILNEAKKKEISLEKIIITSCSHQNIPIHIALFNLSIFFIRPSFSKMASSPTKQGELMAMNIPIICNSGVGDTDEIIQSNNAGIILSELNNDAYDRINLHSLKGSHFREGAIAYFGLNNGIANYKKAYDSC